ncbi:MAG: acyltransferase [Victivallaceae bacterium]|nr:acyltransferase [Victivallaceae bacterium]
MALIPETDSRRIRAIRYIGILGVVFCHAIQGPFFFLNGNFFLSSEYTLNDNFFGLVHSLIIYGFFYGAVPMFFIFSAYLQFLKPRDYRETVSRRVRSLLIPMALWTAINVVMLFLLKYGAGIIFYPKLLSSTDWCLWLKALFGDYSRAWVRGTHCPLIMYQFWFIRDLFILTLFSPVIGFLMRETKRGIVSLIVFGAILDSGCRPVIVGGDSLFYFSVGAFFALHKIDFFAVLDRYWHWVFTLALSCTSVALMYIRYDGNPDPDAPMLIQVSSTLFLMKLSGAIAAKEKVFKIADALDGQAFFLYCAHAPCAILLFCYIAYWFLPDTVSNVSVAGSMLAISVVDTVLCTLVGIAFKHFAPGVFALLTGNRKQSA